ncbi:MAG TPA: hypothetical protein VJL29_07365 [Thermoguttaceae bacterium]|nr:hypothetical protein [Thermoguttaceae bacterium]
MSRNPRRILAALAWTVCVVVPCVAALAEEPTDTNKDKYKGLSVEIIPTIGPQGPRREPVYIAGDVFNATLKISGLKTRKNGEVDWNHTMALCDRKGNFVENWGNAFFRNAPSLGGSTVYLQLATLGGPAGGPTIPLRTPPGDYQVRVTTFDNLVSEKVTKSIPITVLPMDTFGAVGQRLCNDPQGQKPAGTHVMVGQAVGWLFAIVNQTVIDDRAKVRITASVEDKTGKEVSKPVSRTIEPKANEETNVRGPLGTGQQFFLNRPGEFTLKLELVDLLSKDKRKVSYKMPVVVVEP